MRASRLDPIAVPIGHVQQAAPRVSRERSALVDHDVAVDYAALDRPTVTRRAQVAPEATQEQLDAWVAWLRTGILVRQGEVITEAVADERARNLAMQLPYVLTEDV